MEPYINLVSNKFKRSLIAKLNVELGRFTQTRLEDRLCEICQEGFVEDEIHCVCVWVCSKYRTEKENLYLKSSNKYINLKHI